MNAKWRGLARRILPPVVADALSRRRGTHPGGSSDWAYVEGTELPDTSNEGWDDASVAAEEARKWDLIQRLAAGTGPLGIAHHAPVPTNDDYRAHNIMMTFGYVLALTARGRKTFSLLDWGGGLGEYLIFARALLPGAEIDYHVKELSPFCVEGRRLLPDVTFFDDDSYLERDYDLVMASGSLQYAQDWRETLTRLIGIANDYVYVVTIVVRDSPAFLAVQRAHAYGYHADFVGRVFNRGELIAHAESQGAPLRREFLNEEMAPIPGAPERPRTMGFLFQKVR